MPAKPSWYGKLESVIEDLRASPRSFVDRATVEFLLGVGRRRAQQIMAGCITDHVGANGLADREKLIERLQGLAESEARYYEVRRRDKVAEVLGRLRQQRLERPQLFVEAPAAVVHQGLEDLPPSVRVEPGRVTVEFEEPHELLEKLLALAMAISNDFDAFERSTRRS